MPGQGHTNRQQNALAGKVEIEAAQKKVYTINPIVNEQNKN